MQFGNPPLIFFESKPIELTWFYEPQYSRHLAEALVNFGWPVLFVEPPEDDPSTSGTLEFDEVGFGLWRCAAWPRDPVVIRRNLMRLAESFPASAWVFRHSRWTEHLWTHDLSNRVVIFDRREASLADPIHRGSNRQERRLAAVAQVVLTNSVSQLIKWSRINERTVYLQNARVPSRYLASHIQLQELDRIPRPRLLVIDYFNDLLDADLVEFVAETRPDWSIVIIGSTPSYSSSGPARTNIHYLGRRLYAELPAYALCCDAGLIPLREHAAALGINPAIVQDYRAASLPVVTTFLPELLLLDDPGIFVAADRQSFITAITFALSQQDKTAKCAPDMPTLPTWEEQARKLILLATDEPSLAAEMSGYENLLGQYYLSIKKVYSHEEHQRFVRDELVFAAYAHGIYDDVIQLADPTMPVYGCSLIRLSKLEEARRWLDEYLTFHAQDRERSLVQHFDENCLAAYLFMLNGEMLEATRALARVQSQHPARNLLAGRLWFQLGYSDEAAFHYGEALTANPDLLYANDYLNIGDIMLENGRVADAEQAYVQASVLGAPAQSQRKLADLYRTFGFQTESREVQ